MLQTKTFRKSMEEKELWEKVAPLVKEATDPATGKEDMTVFISLLDEKLPSRERLSVMEELGCSKSPAVLAPHKEFRKKYADRTLAERVSQMNEIHSPHKAPTELNNDGTLRVFWAFGEENHRICVCSCKMIKQVKKSEIPEISATYCACCGGHVKAVWQTALGCKLRLKEVVCSVLTSGGKKPCEFLFEVIEG